MAKVDNPGIWEKIQKNVQETERLMGQKKYNQSMIKARQTLEYMVKLKCDQAGIVESSLDLRRPVDQQIHSRALSPDPFHRQ